jgi:succinyl-diaminopimelate desuccinylase
VQPPAAAGDSGFPDVVTLLAQLVAIDSANASMSPAAPGEAELARTVAALGERAGATATLDEALPGRPNVLVRLPATVAAAAAVSGPRANRSGVPCLLFDVHLDTVPLEPMQDATTPRVADGRLRARGACDTKGALAAALVALHRLAAEGAPRQAEVLLLCSVDEEYLKRGVAHAVATGACRGATAAVVGEPTLLRPVIAHKGAVRWRITVNGKAAHTSRPENGINAIYGMVEVIEALRERLEPRLAQEAHPLLTPPTLTVGRIQGGVGVNIVPDACSIEIDRRTLPREDPGAILAEVDAILADLTRRNPELHAVREEPFLSERGLETAPEEPLVALVQRACAAVTGEDAAPSGVPYGTDATHLSPLGIPTVVLGPGDIAQAHTADEWVELRQVEQAAEIYYRIMREFVSEPHHPRPQGPV